MFKFIVNDFGLETLHKLFDEHEAYGPLLKLIDDQMLSNNSADNNTLYSLNTQGVFQLIAHYSCVPETPLYYLLDQRIKRHADQIKLTLIHKYLT